MKPTLTDETLSRFNFASNLHWNEDFGSNDMSKWQEGSFASDGLHRTGYKNLSIDGDIVEGQDWSVVPGRWAGFPLLHTDKTCYVEPRIIDDPAIPSLVCVMKLYAEETPNPYRKNFADAQHVALVHRYGDFKIAMPWKQTWSRTYFQKLGRHITDTSKPTMTCGPGSVIEARVNLEKMLVRAARWSLWGQPATDKPDTPERMGEDVSDKAYNADTKDGIEMDNPEVEASSPADPNFKYKASSKLVGGLAGDTADGMKDLLKEFGIDISKGWHTFTTVWRLDGNWEFYCDRILINLDHRSVLVQMCLIMSREVCSGVKGPEHSPGDWENQAGGPYKPADPGLSGQSVILDLDKFDEDEVLVDYVRVYTIESENDSRLLTMPDLTLDEPDAIVMPTEDELNAVEDDDALYSDMGDLVTDVPVDDYDAIQAQDMEDLEASVEEQGPDSTGEPYEHLLLRPNIPVENPVLIDSVVHEPEFIDPDKTIDAEIKELADLYERALEVSDAKDLTIKALQTEIVELEDELETTLITNEQYEQDILKLQYKINELNAQKVIAAQSTKRSELPPSNKSRARLQRLLKRARQS